MTLEGALLYPASLGVYDGRLMDSEFFCVTYKCQCISGKGKVQEAEWKGSAIYYVVNSMSPLTQLCHIAITPILLYPQQRTLCSGPLSCSPVQWWYASCWWSPDFGNFYCVLFYTILRSFSWCQSLLYFSLTFTFAIFHYCMRLFSKNCRQAPLDHSNFNCWTKKPKKPPKPHKKPNQKNQIKPTTTKNPT